jgi:hypothetical protein
MHRSLRISAVALISCSWQVHAQATPSATIGLSDTQKADILSHNTEQSVDGARAGLSDGKLPGAGIARGIHGEIGAEIGSHGERGMFGAAAIPLGDHAGATVMFEDEHYGRR